MTASAVESGLASSVAETMVGGLAPVEPAPTGEAEKFPFDEDFQDEIGALTLRDPQFVRRIGHLLHPSFFENEGTATIVNIVLEHFKKYGDTPSFIAFKDVLINSIKSGRIRVEVAAEVNKKFKQFKSGESLNIRGLGYYEERIGDFARNQAMTAAILKSVDLIAKKKFDEIGKAVTAALQVGKVLESTGVSYFDTIADRTARREERAAGLVKPNGITTGHRVFDDYLMHKGWGRKELSVLMGGAKSGKTTAMINHARYAAEAGYDVLYVTLEVSAAIISDRLDACISGELIQEIAEGLKAKKVEHSIEAAKARSGKFWVEEFPSGTMTPAMLQRLIDRHKSNGIKFDLIVVDYADLMAPNHRTDSAIENSKSVYVDLRAIAFLEGCAVLTATQTNREGYKSVVAKAEHVSEDFNKIRIADIVISINATEEERKDREARLYFAACRNQAAGFSIVIKQDLERMRFIESILRVE